MPDDISTLSQGDREKVLAWVDSKTGGNRTCRTCGGLELAVGDLILLPLPGMKAFRGAVTVRCANCGELKFFDIATMGVIPSPPH